MGIKMAVKIEGTTGNCQAEGYEQWIECQAYNIGVYNTCNALRGEGASGTGTSEPGDFSFSKFTDPATCTIWG
ncbi:MAG: type VI secretion system tube protein Hcp, partial [Gammaproteobacteria bacterium]